MIVDVAYLSHGIEVSYVNEQGGIDIKTYPVCEQPYQFPVWQISDHVEPQYADIQDWRKLPVTRVTAKRFNQFDLLQFLFELPEADKVELFAYRRPKLYFYDIETEIGNGFPKPDKAEMPINAISTCDEQCNCVIQTTVDLLNDDDLRKSCGKQKPTLDDAFEFVNNIIQEYMGQHCFAAYLKERPTVKIFQHANEHELLHFWVTKLFKNIPALTGWNINGFDNIYVKNRCAMHNIDLALASPVGRTVWGNGMPYHKYIDDYMQLMDTYDYSVWQKESLRLDYIAHRMFGVGKLPYDCTLKELYLYHPCTFIAYNAVDTMVNAMIAAKTDLISNVMSLSNMTNIDMNHCQGPVKQSEGVMMTYLYNKYGGKVVCAQGGPENVVHSFEGGFVKQPFNHWARMVVCVDANSLYPSSMRSANISPDNFIRRLTNPDEIEHYKADPNYFVSVNNCLYDNREPSMYKETQEQLGNVRNYHKKLQFWYANNHVRLIEEELARRGAIKL